MIVLTITSVCLCFGCATGSQNGEQSDILSKQEVSGRIDPIFGKATPLLFAHRGGAREVAESTKRGFRHAKSEQVHADVFELDVHALYIDRERKNREFVVWHGPELSNIRIGFFRDSGDKKIRDKENRPGKRTDEENDIRKWYWDDLKGKAWVADPEFWLDSNGKKKPKRKINLSTVDQNDDRLMITLEEFFEEFPDSDVNIELKDSVSPDDLGKLVELLDRHRRQRTILVVSLSDKLIEAFRKLSGDRYPSGLSLREVIDATVGHKLSHDALPDIKQGRALQTTYDPRYTPPGLIRAVHVGNGAVHVFLTKFSGVPAIDAQEGRPTNEELYKILDRSVDGVMTDRPERVRGLIDAWRKQIVP